MCRESGPKVLTARRMAGVAKGTTPEDEKRQDAYVANVMAGMPKTQAAIKAGYSAENPNIHQIERPGGPVESKLLKALDAAGLDENKMAQMFNQVFTEAPTEKGRSGDYGAVVKALYTLATLRGYGKRESPAVAVQINNAAPNGPLEGIDQGTARKLIDLVEAELRQRESAGVHEGNSHPSPQDSQAHSGMDSAPTDAQEIDSGGQP